MRPARLCGLSSLVLVLVPALATAAPVAPGESVEIDTFENPPVLPTGPKLGEQTIPFTLNYALPPGPTAADPTPSPTGLLTQSVFRNTTTGGLTFVYDIDVQDEILYVDEVSRLTVGSFTSFSTDVTGSSSEHTSILRASRSADGATIRTIASEGLGGAPLLIVDTNATAFDRTGAGEYFADAEFVVTGPDVPNAGQVDMNATANFTGLFQPAAGPGPRPRPTPAGRLGRAADRGRPRRRLESSARAAARVANDRTRDTGVSPVPATTGTARPPFNPHRVYLMFGRVQPRATLFRRGRPGAASRFRKRSAYLHKNHHRAHREENAGQRRQFERI